MGAPLEHCTIPPFVMTHTSAPPAETAMGDVRCQSVMTKVVCGGVAVTEGVALGVTEAVELTVGVALPVPVPVLEGVGVLLAVLVLAAVTVPVLEGVGVKLAVLVLVVVPVPVAEGVGVLLAVMELVSVPVPVREGVGVLLAVLELVSEAVPVFVGVSVLLAEVVLVGEAVPVLEEVGVGLTEIVLEDEPVPVTEEVGVLVWLALTPSGSSDGSEGQPALLLVGAAARNCSLPVVIFQVRPKFPLMMPSTTKKIVAGSGGVRETVLPRQGCTLKPVLQPERERSSTEQSPSFQSSL